jgi:hypothetical protein
MIATNFTAFTTRMAVIQLINANNVDNNAWGGSWSWHLVDFVGKK